MALELLKVFREETPEPDKRSKWYTVNVKTLDTAKKVAERLSRTHVDEYVQAKKTISNWTGLIIDPFKNSIVEREEQFIPTDKEPKRDRVYADDVVEIKYSISVSDQTRSPKDIVTTLDSHLRTMGDARGLGVQSFGLKVFQGNILTVDPMQLLALLDVWENEVIGKSERRALTVSQKEPKTLEEHLTGQFILRDANPLVVGEKVTTSDAYTYACAVEQVARLKGAVINPFETVFKLLIGEKNKDMTTRALRTYGNSAVQVETVPQPMPQYDLILSKTRMYIDAVASMNLDDADGVETFPNFDVDSPRTYMALTSLRTKIDELIRTETKLNYKQGVNVLYNPKEAIIISREA